MSRIDPDLTEPGETMVTLKMPLSAALSYSESMSDLLCWARGYKAACPEDHERHPMGVDDLRSFRLFLIRQIEAARKGSTA